MNPEKFHDLDLVEIAGLTREIRVIAMTAISSLHFLKDLSLKLGVPMEEITSKQILNECVKADERVRQQATAFEKWILDTGSS